MPELKLDALAYEIFSIESSTALSIYVEKGKVKLIFRGENFSEVNEIFIAGQKKSWDKNDLLPYFQLIIVGLSLPSVVLHYNLA